MTNQTDNKPEPEKNQAEPGAPLTRIEHIRQEANRRAEELAKSFNLMEWMHLERLGFYENEYEEDYDNLRVSLNVRTGPRSQTRGTIHLENLNEALQEFLLQRLPPIIEKQLIHEHLSGDPRIDVTGL